MRTPLKGTVSKETQRSLLDLLHWSREQLFWAPKPKVVKFLALSTIHNSSGDEQGHCFSCDLSPETF